MESSPNAKRQRSEEEAARSERTLVHQGKVITVYEERLTFHDGRSLCLDTVLHPGAVAVLPLDRDGKIVFIKQWRRNTGKILIEIPAGCLEPGETPESCADRELQEEIGFRAKTLISLGGFYTSPGFCNEYIHLFLGKNLIPSRLEAEDSEYIDPFPLSLEEALAYDEEFDAKTLCALHRYRLYCEKEKS